MYYNNYVDLVFLYASTFLMNVNKCERKKNLKKLILFYHSQFNWNFKYQKDKVFYQVGIVGFFFLFSFSDLRNIRTLF